jgi:hypothetical protein
VAIRKVPPFSVMTSRPSGREVTAQGLSKSLDKTSTRYSVLVFTPGILVCPAKAGEYPVLGRRFSTGGRLPISISAPLPAPPSRVLVYTLDGEGVLEPLPEGAVTPGVEALLQAVRTSIDNANNNFFSILCLTPRINPITLFASSIDHPAMGNDQLPTSMRNNPSP